MAMAVYVKKQTAVCFECRGKYGPAILTHKKGGTSERIEIGDAELYEARCRTCHKIPDIE
jgi:thymidine kinase